MSRSLRLVSRLSVRRSRKRDEVLRFLATRDRATLQEIASACAMTPDRAFAVLHGGRPGYAPELSPVGLGQVRVVRSRFGVEYEMTDRGDFEAGAISVARETGRRL